MTVPRHLFTPAPRAPHTLGPTQTPDRVKAPGVINQELEVDQGIHRGRLLPVDNGEHPRSQDRSSGTSVISTDRRQDPRTNLPTTTLKPVMSLLYYRRPRTPSRIRGTGFAEKLLYSPIALDEEADPLARGQREVAFDSSEEWCRLRDSNPRPPDYKSEALPTELNRLRNKCTFTSRCPLRQGHHEKPCI